MAIPRSQEEIEALIKFRLVVEDLNFDDGSLMRFLRARELDFVKAEDMLRKFVEWRVNARCNQYLDFQAPLVLLNIPSYLTGFDDEDRPVFWHKYGNWPSIRDLINSGMTDDILKWAGQCMENVHQLLLRTKHQQCVAMVDCDGLTFSKVFYEASNMGGLTLLMGLMRDYEQNFPELLHKAIIFNAPMAFMWAWKIVSPCLAPYTLSKIEFYGAGSGARKQWETALFDDIPARCIPEIYDGQATEVTSLCQDLIPAWDNHCLKRPESNHNNYENN